MRDVKRFGNDDDDDDDDDDEAMAINADSSGLHCRGGTSSSCARLESIALVCASVSNDSCDLDSTCVSFPSITCLSVCC